MRLSNACFLVALLVGPLNATTARADAVGPPPADCPEGSRGESCHGSEYCAVASCIGPRDCAFGERCAARELCLGTVMCFGRGTGTTATEVIADGCAGCAGRCENQFVCVGDALDAGARDAGRRDAGALDTGGRDPMDAGTGDDPRHSRYCGCAVPSRTEGVPMTWLGLGALLGIARVRRRQSQPTRSSSIARSSK